MICMINYLGSILMPAILMFISKNRWLKVGQKDQYMDGWMDRE